MRYKVPCCQINFEHLLELEICQDVLLEHQFGTLILPASTSKSLFGGAAVILVPGLRTGVSHHTQAHAVLLKLAHHVTRVVHQRVQIKRPAVFLMIH